MAKGPAMIRYYDVYFQANGSSLRVFVSSHWGASELEACNRARAKRWGTNFPKDKLGGVLFGELNATRPEIERNPHKPRQDRMFG